jgi:hypothetical protein
MEEMNEIKNLWARSRDQRVDTYTNLNSKEMITLIKSRIKKEKKKTYEYIMALGVWQLLIYSFMSHLVVKYWGDWSIMGYALGGMLLYIPYTVVYARKFTGKNLRSLTQPNSPLETIKINLKNQYTLLAEFFSFKKKFDLVGIPLSCFIILMLLSNLRIIPGVASHVTMGIILYLIYLAMFITATIIDNRKRFKLPLQHLKVVLEEMEEINDLT